MFTDTFTLKKKHLGWALALAGSIGFLMVLGIDIVAIIRESGPASLFTAETVERMQGPMGIGPAQRLALATCVGMGMIGITLIPLGDRPA